MFVCIWQVPGGRFARVYIVTHISKLTAHAQMIVIRNNESNDVRMSIVRVRVRHLL
jgi:hypothetical protein